ncbi:cation transporter [Entomomonas sp. E2T0]|uniref:cation diffusion facilitator family transporter n=1 Tax=Entomomonas sp. E2T0 TaxID=2930213 RepID=UPI0022281182|nr:cation transporter [Entomomonas sp. E2T0]UYZ85009.1 cation transporter [Entomomonas sp. E2T0]
MSTTKEVKIFKLSISVTLVIAAIGILFGLLSGSQSILFDGIFSTIDTAMSILSVLVIKLMAKESTSRFQFGFWHFEPIVATVNGSIILLLCLYAQLNAILNIIDGGQSLTFSFATIYAVLVCSVCFGMYFYEKRVNKQLKSDLLQIDVNSWLMSSLITSALLVAFIIGLLIQGTQYEYWSPYIDSVALLVLTVFFIPVPLKILKQSLQEIFLVASKELDNEVNQLVSEIVKQHGLVNYESYVVKTGRLYSIEIHLITSESFAKEQGVIALDNIREQIASQLSIPAQQRWLTICFTSKEKWSC